MLIIFEGPDGGGKSSIIEAFNKATNYAHILVDRMHLSHMVYANIYKRREYASSKLSDKAADDFLSFMGSVKPLIVYVTANPIVLEKRIAKRGESPFDGPNAVVAMSVYAGLIRQFEIEDRVLELDTTANPPMQTLVRKILGKVAQLSKTYVKSPIRRKQRK